MSEHAQLGFAQTGGINNRGMHELVDHDDIVFSDQRADGPKRRRVPGRKRNRRWNSFEFRDSLFQPMMDFEGAANEPGSARPGPKIMNGCGSSFLERGMIGEAEIIVG